MGLAARELAYLIGVGIVAYLVPLYVLRYGVGLDFWPSWLLAMVSGQVPTLAMLRSRSE